MKEGFAEREVIDARGRRAVVALIYVTGVVYPVAETRVGFQARSIWQVHCVRRDVVDGSPLVVGGPGLERRRRHLERSRRRWRLKRPRRRERRENDRRSPVGG